MALIHTSRATLPGTRLAAGMNATMSSWFAAFSSWNQTRTTRIALNKLSERELEDIGLCRAEIDRVSGR